MYTSQVNLDNVWGDDRMVPGPLNLKGVLSRLQLQFARRSETPILDAQVLLAEILHKPRTWVMAHPETLITGKDEQTLENILVRLEAGEPLPYILGHWEFFGLTFAINSAVLIPRPETELLVEQAVDWLRKHPVEGQQVVDIGTGSGCIAISLAIHVKGLQVVATDLSSAALQVAQANARQHGVNKQVNFVQCNLFPPGDNLYHLICSNPPYIPTGMLDTLSIAENEPLQALDGGPDGLDVIQRLLLAAPQRLASEGRLLVEIEESQGARVLTLAQAAFPDSQVEVMQDLAGRDRLLIVDMEPG
jgi:release factor glutamine methyltransferase